MLERASQERGPKTMQMAKTFPVRLSMLAVVVGFGLLFATGCNLSNSKSAPVTPTAEVSVMPGSAEIRAGDKVQFSATVKGIASQAVTWSVNGSAGGNSTVGTVDATGLYHAPATVPNPNSVQVEAASAPQKSASSSSAVTVDNPVPVVLSMLPTTLPVGNFTLSVTGKNFVNGAVVVFGALFLPTTFVSSTQLTATGTASQSSAGPIQVTVLNPDPGSTSSSAFLVEVGQPAGTASASVAARFLEQSTWGPKESETKLFCRCHWARAIRTTRRAGLRKTRHSKPPGPHSDALDRAQKLPKK